jgi:hypothetical protein
MYQLQHAFGLLSFPCIGSGGGGLGDREVTPSPDSHYHALLRVELRVVFGPRDVEY